MVFPVQDSAFNSAVVEHLFGRVGTHFHIDSVILSQFAFSRSKYYQNIFRSASCIVLFKQPSDRAMVANLNAKMFTGHPKFLNRAMRRAEEIVGVHNYIGQFTLF